MNSYPYSNFRLIYVTRADVGENDDKTYIEVDSEALRFHYSGGQINCFWKDIFGLVDYEKGELKPIKKALLKKYNKRFMDGLKEAIKNIRKDLKKFNL